MSGPRILLIDYEPESVQNAERSLSAAGYRVEIALDGPSGLSAFANLRPDLVLIDPMIPKMHGFEVCREIKRSPGGESIPVWIATTSYRGPEFEEEAKRYYGCDGYLEKPVDGEEWVAICRRALAREPGAPHPPAAPESVADPASGGTVRALDDLTEEEIVAWLDAVITESRDPVAAPPSRGVEKRSEVELPEEWAEYGKSADSAELRSAPAEPPGETVAQPAATDVVKSPTGTRLSRVLLPATFLVCLILVVAAAVGIARLLPGGDAPPLVPSTPSREVASRARSAPSTAPRTEAASPEPESAGPPRPGGRQSAPSPARPPENPVPEPPAPAARTLTVPASSSSDAPAPIPSSETAPHPARILDPPANPAPSPAEPETGSVTVEREPPKGMEGDVDPPEVDLRVSPQPAGAGPGPAEVGTSPVGPVSGEPDLALDTSPLPTPSEREAPAGRPVVDPAPPPPRPAALYDLEEVEVAPTPLRKTVPEYPDAARRLRLGGTVLLNLLVDENGRVAEVEVTNPGTPRVLSAAAVRAARHWTYRPATKEGVPVRVWITAKVVFQP